MKKLPDMKFRITSPEQSAAIQEKLFSLGYAWAGVYSERYVRFTDKPFLYFNRGMVQCSGGGDAYFNAEPHQECVLEGGEFVPVGQNDQGGSAALTRCAAARDGECRHANCPQLRDNEPKASGRHCPLDTQDDED